MRSRLNAVFIKTAVAEPGKDRTVYWDEALPGFGLVVTATGARSYVVQYRINGQSRRLTIDSKLTLADARREARKRMGEVAKGGDPVAEQRERKAAAEAATTGTLEHIAREYFRREERKIRTMRERESTFERLVFPRLGSRQIGEIQRIGIARLLDVIEDKRGPVMATKTLAFLSKLFAWHASRSNDFRSPIVRGMSRSKPRERARDRILTDDEIRAVWRTADQRPGAFASLIKFVLLTATRRSEAAQMTRGEIVDGVWVIPASRAKAKAEVVLPLSSAALAVLDGVPVIGRKDGPIFTTDGERPIAGFSKAKRALDSASGVTGWRLHDLRRSARSLMSRAGVPPDIAERCLGHVIPGVRAVYDRHSFEREKREAFEALAGEIETIIQVKQRG